MWKAVDDLLARSIAEGIFPGCAMAAGQGTRVLFTSVHGTLAQGDARGVTHTTRYDVGLLTEVMAVSYTHLSLWAFGPSAHRAHASLRACRGLGQSPKALCRSIFRERCERPKNARNAALSKTMGFSTVWAARRNAGRPFLRMSVTAGARSPCQTKWRRARRPQRRAC